MEIGIQEIIEKYYPNYYSDGDIALLDDLEKIIFNNYEDGDSATNLLNRYYNGDANHPDIKEDYEIIANYVRNSTMQAMYQLLQECKQK